MIGLTGVYCFFKPIFLERSATVEDLLTDNEIKLPSAGEVVDASVDPTLDPTAVLTVD
jgi:hypothetical protein